MTLPARRGTARPPRILVVGDVVTDVVAVRNGCVVISQLPTTVQTSTD